MRVTVNGKELLLDDRVSVAGLLESLGVNPRLVVVERNLAIVDRDRYDAEAIEEGDSIEIIRFVGGG
jgi:thiamine biosynthesis protein ThiS